LKAKPQAKEASMITPSSPPTGEEKPKDELDLLLTKIKEKDDAKKRAKEALVRKFKQLLQDTEKYKKIESSNLDEATKLAAWDILKTKYPKWTDSVEPGDSDALVSCALTRDNDGSLRKVIELQKKPAEKKRLASIPKAVTDAKVYKVKLRDVSEELWDSDVKKMVEEYNFFVKDLNKDGDFPNDFVDNGNGTITDRATGLMWQKEGSSSVLYYWKVKKYVSGLNEENYSGHDDWRIPTLEELCSLLEREVNQRVQHISSLFGGTQSKCWSEDHFEGLAGSIIVLHHHIVNFTNGKIDEVIIKDIHDGDGIHLAFPCFVRTVRTLTEKY
jgi:hypothetical protein